MKKVLSIVTVILLILGFLLTPMFQVLKSYAIMSIYSKMNERNSFLSQENIKIKIPGGLATKKKDYYPFVIVFDASSGFSKLKKTDTELVIYYNFGAMDWTKGASSLYDVESDYYSSFYGLYAVKYNDLSRQFGLDESDDLYLDEIMDVTDYDIKNLVLRSIGCRNPVVEYDLLTDISLINIDHKDFQVFDASIRMSGMSHSYEKDYQAYIQYGRPSKADEPDKSFEIVDMLGRIYCYFDEKDKISYFFYIIAPNIETIEEVQSSIIIKSTLSGIERL